MSYSDEAAKGLHANPAMDLRIEHALGQVYDPCSLVSGAPLSIVEMGLVLGWEYGSETRELAVLMTVTSPGCWMLETIVEGIEEKCLGVPEIDAVRVEVDMSRPWSSDAMTDDGRAKLATGRARWLERRPVRPQEWRYAAGLDSSPSSVGAGYVPEESS